MADHDPSSVALDEVDSARERDALVRFEPCSAGIRVVDTIERRRDILKTPTPVSPRRIGTDAIDAPVDAAVALETTALAFDRLCGVYVWESDGGMIDHLAEDDVAHFEDGTYRLQITAPIQLYVEVKGTVRVDATDRTRITVYSDTAVRLGARSAHDHPAGTVTTTRDPQDLMRAVSTFGSAMKTFSPERSWPTLRGHPPAVELGATLEIPPGVEPPETGLRIEVPPTVESVLEVAPLAYYLGADLVPGDRPKLTTDSGFEYPLDQSDTLAETVGRTLEQVLFLESLIRTEGLYRVPLAERNRLEQDLPFDFATMYGTPADERLETLLSVPYAHLAPHIPEWEVKSYVEPTAESVETLPYLVDDLSPVVTIDPPEVERPTVADVDSSGPAPGHGHTVGETPGPVGDRPAAVDQFTRAGTFVRNSSSTVDGPTAEMAGQPDRFVELPDTTALETVWVGGGVPVNATKANPTAFVNQLNRTPTDDEIEVALVCNDDRMADELEAVDGTYGTESTLPFDVTTYRSLSRTALLTLLEDGTDFLHYVGHAEADGLRCADGKLDVRSLDRVGVDAFLLNACQSYEQGHALVEAGAIGGVVTLSDIVNMRAVTFGRTVARLLNAGFPLRAAMDLATRGRGRRAAYTVVGTGGYAIAQRDAQVITWYDIEPRDDGQFEIQIRTYPTNENGIGGTYRPFLGEEEFFLIGKFTDSFVVSADGLREFLCRDRQVDPAIIGGDLYCQRENLLSALGMDSIPPVR